MKNVSITVFTPTYNRAYCLGRVYESLCNQTSQDFDWLVVDDGSTDNTAELVQEWIKEKKIPIRYIYHENRGMHAAHNTAYENIDSELNVCCDSDDMFTNDAIENILSFWKENKNDDVAGIWALDGTLDGKLLGDPFPEEMRSCRMGMYYDVWGFKGDKKVVYRTDVAKSYPSYPVFPGEKYGSMGYKSLFIDRDYPMLLMNKIIYLVEYQLDGSSHNMFRQYRTCLQGWDVARRAAMKLGLSKKRRFKDAVHYVSNQIFLGKWSFFKNVPHPFYILMALPFGVLLNLYIRFVLWKK